MVEGNGSIFPAGSYLVKAAIGKRSTMKRWGRQVTHTEISGIADYRFPRAGLHGPYQNE